MSGFPVTVVSSGGLPVTASDNGTPCSVVDSGGYPVTVVESGGLPLAGLVTLAGWEFVGSETFSLAAGTTDTRALPGTVQEGDIVLLFAANEGTAFPTGGSYVSTAGYTNIVTSTASTQAHQIAYKVLGAGEADISTLTTGVATFRSGFAIQVWRGIDVSNVIDGVLDSATVSIPANNPFTAPAHDVVQNGALEFVVSFVNEIDPGDALSWDPNGPPPIAPVDYSNLSLLDAGSSGSSNSAAWIASRVGTSGTSPAVEFAGSVTRFTKSTASYHFSLTNAEG